ncbi:hypothetical protein [Peribacillus simplex]|uniref:hypothetical protein n=1 Tax=Peribacillus simplex TaxID=1478 RepID=UPI000970AE41|nr:hypothetical protein [Peribacillus simplex]
MKRNKQYGYMYWIILLKHQAGNFSFESGFFLWGCEYYLNGRMVGAKGLEKLKHDSVICGLNRVSYSNRYSWNRDTNNRKFRHYNFGQLPIFFPFYTKKIKDKKGELL